METDKRLHGFAIGRGRSIGRTVNGLAIASIVLMSALLGCQPQTAEKTDQVSSEEARRSPLEVVNLRMQAYNEHDLERFLSTYSEDVEIFTYPDKSLGKGKKRLRNLFEDLFKEGSPQVDIHHQITKDGYVVNHETVVSGGKETEYVSIYEVRQGLIRSVRFVRD